MTVSDNRDDYALVQRIARGDESAFQELFDRVMGDVFRLSYALLLDYQAAEDATQDAFIRLWQNAEKWQPEASIKTWLLTVARNICLDTIRKKKNDLKKHQGLYVDSLSAEQHIKTDAIENKIDRKQHEEMLKNALFTLPERQREAVTLVYYMEVNNSEAARIMGLKVRAFDSLLARARRSLRSALGDEEDVLKGYNIYGQR